MADEKTLAVPSRKVAAEPSCSRRQLVRGAVLAACAPALAPLAGCARRIAPDRDLSVGAPVDGRLVVPISTVPEVGRPGGAAVLHNACVNPILLVNTGSGFLAMSALCPHSSCELAWVEEDRQAECPCHGSRFAGDGTVLNGPAVTNVNTYPATMDGSGAIVVNLFAGDGIFPALVDSQLVFELAKYPALQNAGGSVVGHPDGSPISVVVTRPLTPPPSPPADGGLLAMSALCTHAACTVLPVSGSSPPVLRCPCHGSEFLLDGTVNRRPAVDPLTPLPLKFDPNTGTVTIQLFPTC